MSYYHYHVWGDQTVAQVLIVSQDAKMLITSVEILLRLWRI